MKKFNGGIEYIIERAFALKYQFELVEHKRADDEVEEYFSDKDFPGIISWATYRDYCYEKADIRVAEQLIDLLKEHNVTSRGVIMTLTGRDVLVADHWTAHLRV